MKISIIVPCFNEQDVLKEANRRIVSVLSSTSYEYEIIYVNDGSKDNTLMILKDLVEYDQNVRVINLSKNFGHQIAVTAGIDNASGDAVVLMDADLQDPPELILDFLQKWEEGYQVVYAIRKQRKGESIFKKVSAMLFYRLLNRITDVSIPIDTGDFRLMDKKIVDILKSLKERHRFIRGLVAWVGFNQIGIEYERAERYAGVTKYPFRKMLKLSIDGITSFSFFPLKIAGFLGVSSAVIGFLGIILSLILKIRTNSILPGWTSLMIVILFLGGMQLFILGIIGEYIGRIYDETRNRPLYIISDDIKTDRRSEMDLLRKISWK